MRCLLIAEESAGLRCLQLMEHRGHAPVAVVTRGLASVAQVKGIPVYEPSALRDPSFAITCRELALDLLLAVRAPYLVPEPLLALPRIGAFNLHTGPLPRYAGRNALNWAIYRREPFYGVTVHRMTAEIDAGDIAYRTLFSLPQDIRAVELTRRCIEEGLRLIETLVDTAARDATAIPREPQNFSQREVFGKAPPIPGASVDFRRPAAELDAYLRASDYGPLPSPWPRARTRWKDRVLEIYSASVTGTPTDAAAGTVGAVTDESVAVACGGEWLLIRDARFVDDEALDFRCALVEGGTLARWEATP